jgi:AcrR family transcriptional regulator
MEQADLSSRPDGRNHRGFGLLTYLPGGTLAAMNIPAGRYAVEMASTRRVAQGAATRTRIIDAATERLAEVGPDASLTVIANDVGVTKGAMYHHFGSKERLVEEVYKEAIRRHADRILAVTAEGTGRERLMALIMETASLYGSGSPFYRLLLRLHAEAGASRPHLAPIARRVQRRQVTYVTELVQLGQQDGSIRADVDAGAVAHVVNATVQGLLIQELEPLDVQKSATEQFGFLLQRLLAST